MVFIKIWNSKLVYSISKKACVLAVLGVLSSCNSGRDSGLSKEEAVTFEADNYAQWVNTEIGNEGKGVSETELQFEAGFTFPGATTPFGMVQFTQTFFQPQRGFVVNQLSGAGCPNMGNFPTTVLSGDLKESPKDMLGLKTTYDNQVTQAGYYKTKINSGIIAELTATPRTGMARFTFSEDDQTGTVLIGSGINANKTRVGSIEIIDDHKLVGYADGGSFCGSPTPYMVYFVAEFDRPFTKSGTWSGDSIKAGESKVVSENTGAFLTFDVSSDKDVNYKFAISYVSIANAQENLKTENPSFDFDKVKDAAQDQWNSYLSKIKVKGGSKDETQQFYTHLYNTLKHPSIFSDVNGEYVGSDQKTYKAEGFDYYTAFSNWDTYRTQTQLIAMLAPEVTSDVVQSHLLFAERSGGGLPRWVLASFATGIMQGDPSSALIANAYAFGAQDFDLQKAYDIMNRGANEVGLKTQNTTTRTFLDQYLEKGYIWDHMGASIALEFENADFAIGQFALQALGDEAAYKKYLNRSQNWKKLYNPETTWLNSRNQDGSWKGQNDDWREASYTNYFWMVPYNLKGLIETMGGKNKAEARLDSLFVRLDATYYQDWFAAGNEPDFQVPWIYNWTNKPYKAQAIVRRILDEKYQNAASGLPGNEDLGAMGAWYVFANMGLYPMVPGVGGFTISSPVFDEIELRLGDDSVVTITGGDSDKTYISSLELDGESWDTPWISLEQLTDAKNLEFKLSENPNLTWGQTNEPPSYDN